MFKPNTNIFGAAQNNSPFGQPQANNAFGNNNNAAQGNVFGGNRNPVGNNPPAINTATNNIFGQTNQQNNSPFGQNNQGNNTFTANNTPNTGAGIFGQNNNTATNSIFGQNTNNQPNNQPQNNNNGLFGQNNNTGGNTLFNARPQGAGIFGNNTQGGQNNANTSIFGANTQNQPNNQPNQMFNQPNNTFAPMVGAGNNPQQFLQQSVPPVHLLSLAPQLQQNYLRSLTADNLRKYVENSLKNLAQVKRIEGIGLSSENSFKNEKVNKFATTHNLKNDLLLMKKDFIDKIETPLKQLNKKDENIMKLSNDLVMKVSAKLQGYKQALIESISQKKMLDDVKRELDNIQSQIKDFLKPLFNSHQTRSNLSFLDPDQFCIKIAEDILRSMTYLDNKMDELLACESDISQQSLDTGDIIDQVVQYYENVVIALRQFAEKYSRQKKEALARRRVGNADEAMKKIVEKANFQVRQQLKAYDLVKEIESILHKRIDKNDTRMTPQDY